MNAQEYRTAAIDLIIRLTGAPRTWAEETCDEDTAAYWHGEWSMGSFGYEVFMYVVAALYDHGFAADGMYYGDDEYKPDWL